MRYSDSDHISGKAYDAHLIKRLWPFVRPHRYLAAFSLLMAIGVPFINVLQPIIIMKAIDEMVAEGSLESLQYYVLIYLGLLILQFIAERIQLYVMMLLGQKFVYDLRMKMFRHVQSLSLSYFTRTPVGKLITRLTNDVENINELFANGLFTIVGDVIMLVGIVTAMLWINWKLALITLIAVPPLWVLVIVFRKQQRDAYRKIRTLAAVLTAYLQENITGMGVVQAFVREDKNLEDYKDRNASYLKESLRSVFFDSHLSSLVEMSGSLAIAFIIWYGGGQIVHGAITFGVLVAFIEYARRFFGPIEEISAKYSIMQNAMASSEKIFRLLDESECIPQSSQAKHISRLKGSIEFKDVSFHYTPEQPVLKNINFKIEPGQTIAVVGATGAGKTTLVKLLNRLYDVKSGAISVDGTDVRDYHLGDLRKNLAVVLQDVFLFSGSIADNISLSNPSINSAKIVEAAHTVNAHRFIDQLPNGYDTPVGERGSQLSTGERQLLSFARALAHDPSILILDEATSSVDTETEMLIQDAVPKLMAGRTAIVIAHRLSTIRAADNILVFHHGELKETGTHDELLKKKGIYYKLYLLQFAHAPNTEARSA